MDSNDGFDAMFQQADSPAWAELMEKAEATATIKQGLDPAVYAAAFSTPAGKAVLEDLYNRYVNVTRCVPGEGSDAAFYREGMAQVVFDIVYNITKANAGE